MIDQGRQHAADLQLVRIADAAGRSRLYAFGLAWANKTKEGDLQGEARAAASRLRATHICLRMGTAAQYGLGDVPDAGRGLPTVYSAAATIAAAKVGYILGAWPLTDGQWYLLASSPSGILPDGDIVLPGEDIARDCFRALFARSGWRQVMAPADWGVAGSAQVDLASLLSGLPHGRLIPKHLVLGRPLRMSGYALAAGIALAGYFLHQHQAAAEKDLERRRVLEAEAATAAKAEASRKAAEEAARRIVWAPMSRTLEVCLHTAATIRVPTIAGWDLAQWTCEPGRFRVRWEPVPGAMLTGIAQHPNVRLSADSTYAELSRDLPLVPTVSTTDRPPSQQYMQLALKDLGRIYLFNAGLSATPESPRLPGDTSKSPGPQLYVTARWTLDTVATAQAWGPALSTIEPLTLSSLTYHYKTGLWKAEGVAYVSP